MKAVITGFSSCLAAVTTKTKSINLKFGTQINDINLIKTLYFDFVTAILQLLLVVSTAV